MKKKPSLDPHQEKKRIDRIMSRVPWLVISIVLLSSLIIIIQAFLFGV